MTRPFDTVERLLGAALLVVISISIAALALAEAGRFSGWAVGVVAMVLAIALLLGARRAIRAAGIAASPAPRLHWVALAVTVGIAGLLFRPPAETLIEGGDASMYLAIGRIVAGTGGLRPDGPVAAGLASETLPALFSTTTRPARLNYFPGGLQLDADGRVEPNFFHLAPAWMAAFDVWFGRRGPLYVSPVFGGLAMALLWAAVRRLSGSSQTSLVAVGLVAASFAEIWSARLPSAEIVTQMFVLASVLGVLVALDCGLTIAAVVAALSAGLAGFARIDALALVTAPLAAIALTQFVVERTRRRLWLTFAVVSVAMLIWALWHATTFAAAYTERITYFALSRNWARALDGRILAAIAAGAALLWFARRVRDVARALPILILFAVSTLVFLQDPWDVAPMPTPLRRFVPVVWPLGSALVAYLASRLVRGPATNLAVLGAAAILIGGVFRESMVLVAAPPFQGVRADVARVVAAIPPDALTIVDRRTPSHLALALHYHFDRDSVAVTGPDPSAVSRVARAALTNGRPVRLIVSPDAHLPGGLARADFASLAIDPIGAVIFGFPVFERSADALPRRTVPLSHGVEIYAVAATSPGAGRLPHRIDIGHLDFGAIDGGFHAAELMAGTMARWTNGEARLVLPPIAVAVGREIEIVCRLAPWPPDGKGLPVALEVEGTVLGSFVVMTAGFAEHRVRLTSEVASLLRSGGVLTVRSATYVPADAGASTDRRTLGVALDWIEIR